VTREPAFPKHLHQLAIAKLLIIDNKRPTIPAFVLPAVKKLICQCWKRNHWHRPTFEQILDQLEAMKFKLTVNVNSSKLSAFMKVSKTGKKPMLIQPHSPTKHRLQGLLHGRGEVHSEGNRSL
jgi:hypothetical protein